MEINIDNIENIPLWVIDKKFGIFEITKYVDRSQYFDKYKKTIMTGAHFDCDYYCLGKDAFYTKQEAIEKRKELIINEIKKLLDLMLF